MSIAVYAGTFDPVTAGHLSVIRQAARLFAHVVVVVAVNPDKRTLLLPEERLRLLREVVALHPNVSCQSTPGLVVDFARAIGASVLLRGVRGATDAQFETELARLNKQVAPELSTLFIPAEAHLAEVQLQRAQGEAAARRGRLRLLPARGGGGAARAPFTQPRRDPMSLHFIPLGVGDAFSALRYSTCVAVEAEGQVLLLDCPHPVRKMMREASLSAGVALDVDRVSGVALSHLHADHSSGLESLGYFSYFVEGRKMPLLAHPDVSAELWPHHLSAGMGRLIEEPGCAPRPKALEDYFRLVPLSAGAPVDFGPFRVECRSTYHHVPTTAFRVSAGGRMLGFSADTSFDEGLISWLLEADVSLHETNYGVHTPYEKLAALPAAARAKLRLLHYPDEFDLESSNIEPLVQGRRYTV